MPSDLQKFVMKPTLVTCTVKQQNSTAATSSKKRTFALRAIGEGAKGQMQVRKESEENLWWFYSERKE